jgi:hypothetical protein
VRRLNSTIVWSPTSSTRSASTAWLETASSEFKKDLRAKLPVKSNAWLVEKDAGTIARMIVEAAGRPKANAIRASLSPTIKKLSLEKTVDADGKPIHALPRAGRSKVN